MRPFIHFAIVVIMSTLTIAQSLPTPQAVTDPKQIASKPNAWRNHCSRFERARLQPSRMSRKIKRL